VVIYNVSLLPATPRPSSYDATALEISWKHQRLAYAMLQYGVVPRKKSACSCVIKNTALGQA